MVEKQRKFLNTAQKYFDQLTGVFSTWSKYATVQFNEFSILNNSFVLNTILLKRLDRYLIYLMVNFLPILILKSVMDAASIV